ncbi:MAG: L,D-transpeptidase family protein [Pseudomonadota bacterium]
MLVLGIPATSNAEEIATKIVVYKSEHKMELLDKNKKLLKTYKISLGGNPKGAKTQQGDQKTPEGIYSISGRNENSHFYKSLRISYPNEYDIEQARERGVSPGGDVMIHGLPKGIGWVGSMHRLYDTWTAGCIAVTNDEIDEIWKLVTSGTIIAIKP